MVLLEHLVYSSLFARKNVIPRFINKNMELSIPNSHGISIAENIHWSIFDD